jgi:hypothetical protein
MAADLCARAASGFIRLTFFHDNSSAHPCDVLVWMLYIDINE